MFVHEFVQLLIHIFYHNGDSSILRNGQCWYHENRLNHFQSQKSFSVFDCNNFYVLFRKNADMK